MKNIYLIVVALFTIIFNVGCEEQPVEEIHSLEELAKSHSTVQEWKKELDRLEKKGLENLTNQEWEEYNALHKKQMVQIFKWSRSLQQHISEAEDYYSSN